MNQRHLILTVLILVLPFMLFSQTFTISGLVVSGDVNEPAIGANVSVKGSTIGTITDFDGNFTLNVKKGDYIVVSYIGYETQIIQIKSEEFQKIVDLTACSPAGDGYGKDNRFIDFGFDNAPKDIFEALNYLEFLRRYAYGEIGVDEKFYGEEYFKTKD